MSSAYTMYCFKSSLRWLCKKFGVLRLGADGLGYNITGGFRLDKQYYNKVNRYRSPLTSIIVLYFTVVNIHF